jgi:hypothetical protein
VRNWTTTWFADEKSLKDGLVSSPLMTDGEVHPFFAD